MSTRDMQETDNVIAGVRGYRETAIVTYSWVAALIRGNGHRKRCVRIKIPGVISRKSHIPCCLFHLGWAVCSTIYSESNIFSVVSDARRTACCLNRRVVTSAAAEAEH